MIAEALSREFALVASCCKHNFVNASNQRPGIPGDVDWSKVLNVVRFHRVEALAWQTLASMVIPDDVRDELSTAASRTAAKNLLAATECANIDNRFAAAGIPLLFLKGAALAALAYANPALKSSIDIDLLIDTSDLGSAADLLRKLGYRRLIPTTGRDLVAWHRRSKESVWGKTDPPIQIDLHSRTADNPHLIPHIDVHSPSQRVGIARGQHLTTLADDELFAYLAVHGASSAWFRLKWISDFAGFLHPKDPAEIERLYRRSQELGAGRAVGQGLLLADRLFGTLDGNEDLRDELQQDRATRRLFEVALHLLSREPQEPTEHLFGTVPLHLTQFLLQPGWRHKARELSSQTLQLLRRFRR